tara:strand:- start:564 stop:1049 length:486 start_codon:yes stop_codon:yes gene_type:complete
MSLSEYFPIVGKFNFSLDEKLRLQIPSEVRKLYKDLFDHEFYKEFQNSELADNLIEDHKKRLYIWGDENIIKIYFPLISPTIKKFMRMDELSEERIDFLDKIFIKEMDSQYRVKLSDVIDREELNKQLKEPEHKGSYPLIFRGNGDSLLINRKDIGIKNPK